MPKAAILKTDNDTDIFYGDDAKVDTLIAATEVEDVIERIYASDADMDADIEALRKDYPGAHMSAL